MKSATLVVVIAATCLIAGCGPMDSGTKTQVVRIAAPGPTTNWKPCQDADDCDIEVTVTNAETCYSNDIKVEPYVATVARTKRIKWTLPPGYQFCKHAGDGVFLKEIVSETADPFDDENKRKCSNSFEWKRNRPDGKNYEYLLRFRDTAGTKSCVKDPWMRN